MIPYSIIIKYGNIAPPLPPEIKGNWSIAITDPTYTRTLFGAVGDGYGNCYIFGGATSSQFNKYNSITNEISTLSNTLSSSNTIIRGRNNPGLGYCNNKIYLYGGSESTILQDFYSYDILLDQWTTISTSSIPGRRYGCHMVSIGDDLYLYGGKTLIGSSNTPNVGSLHKYNTITEQWTTLATSQVNSSATTYGLCTDGVDLYATNGIYLMKYLVSSNTWITLMSTLRLNNICYANNTLYYYNDTDLYEFSDSTNTMVLIPSTHVIPGTRLRNGALIAVSPETDKLIYLFGSYLGSQTGANPNIFNIK